MAQLVAHVDAVLKETTAGCAAQVVAQAVDTVPLAGRAEGGGDGANLLAYRGRSGVRPQPRFAIFANRASVARKCWRRVSR